jgi:hypothetical protein
VGSEITHATLDAGIEFGLFIRALALLGVQLEQRPGSILPLASNAGPI